MTRKDYELIARVLRDKHERWDATGQMAVRAIAEAFATELATTNPRFDRARFLKACGVDS